MWTSHECETPTISIQRHNTQVVSGRWSNLFPFIRHVWLYYKVSSCVCVCVFVCARACSVIITSKESKFPWSLKWILCHIKMFFFQGDRQNFRPLKTKKIAVQYTLIFMFLNSCSSKMYTILSYFLLTLLLNYTQLSPIMVYLITLLVAQTMWRLETRWLVNNNRKTSKEAQFKWQILHLTRTTQRRYKIFNLNSRSPGQYLNRVLKNMKQRCSPLNYKIFIKEIWRKY
jgi:hypothetical protein